MPKRRNPFGECSPLQFKIHVGKKEVDMGVGQEEKMKNVYDKTRQLLFQGSKKSFAGPVTTDANENVVYGHLNGQSHDEPMEEESPADQMKITTTGTLTAAQPSAGQGDGKPKSAWSNFFSSAKGKGPAPPRDKCRCCRGQAASKERCAFCEQSVCVDCIRTCVSCSGNFCQLCSVMNYEGTTEVSYCLSCAS